MTKKRLPWKDAPATVERQAAIRCFDVAAGGLGGCPFVPGAAGNLPAEDAVHLLATLGCTAGIDLNALCRVVETCEALLSRTLPGHMNRVLKNRPVCA